MLTKTIGVGDAIFTNAILTDFEKSVIINVSDDEERRGVRPAESCRQVKDSGGAQALNHLGARRRNFALQKSRTARIPALKGERMTVREKRSQKGKKSGTAEQYALRLFAK